MMILQETRGNLSSGDQLALDLQFALDKTTTARIGPTPNFTRASTGTFVGSNGLIQTAAVNAARFDHDPITGICRGLLIEESRTNLLFRSAELTVTTGGWTNYQMTGSSTTAPDGTNTATLCTENTVNDSHSIFGSFSGNNRPTTGAVSCTFSIFLKAGTRRYVIVTAGQSPNFVGMMVDTQNWTVTDAKAVGTGWSYTSNRLTDYGNGWYRAELTFTPPAATAVICGFAGSNNSTFQTVSAPTYLGNSSTFIAWGAQLEASSFATSYIPTTTASVVRSADVCSITGAAFTGLWAGEATVLFSGMRYQALATTASRSWALHAGTAATEIYATKFGTQELLGSNNNNILATGTIIPAFQQFKTAHAIKATDYAGSQNGLAVVTSNNAASITPNAFNIGSNFVNTGQLNGTISAIRCFRRRLSNAKPQALTV